MALPAASSPSDIPADYCCDTLSSMADRIRTVAMGGLCSCLDGSCADRTFRSFVSIGPTIQDPLGDSLIVHMSTFAPTSGSSNVQGSLLPVAVYQGDFEVRLLENGWPVIEADELGQVITVPDSDMINAIALHSMGHGERMYRALANAVQKQEMFLAGQNPHIGKIQLSNLAPIQPSAYMVGWACTVRVETVLW
jgi:hypothetical protein